MGAGEWRELSGTMPAGNARAELTLTADEFALDDTLHLVRQHRKPLRWTSLAAPSTFQRLFEANGLERAKDIADADLEVRANDLAPADVDHARLLIPTKPAPDSPYVRTPANPTAHRLTESLIFDGLLWRECAPLDPPGAGDTVLLWSGGAPVAILRGPNTLELGFHSDLSNLHRVPSALVMVQRWLDELRESKVAPESRQLSTGDRFEIAADPGGDELELAWAGGSEKSKPLALASLVTPKSPGALTLTQGDTTLLEAAVNFVDPLESDFSSADAGFVPAPEPISTVQAATLPDRFRDLWLLLALAALLLSWTFPESNAKPQPATA